MQNVIMSIIIGFFATFGILFFALLIFVIFSSCKMFEKAGKPSWAAIIPVYNLFVMLEIIGYKWYYIFLFFASVIPVVGPIFALLFTLTYSVKQARSFGQEVGFGIGLWLLSPIFTAIIAFSKDIKYVGPAVKGDIDFNDLF